MIELNITESSDFNRIGHYQFHKDEILIGLEISSDIFLPKENLNPHHVILTISDKILNAEVLSYENIQHSFMPVSYTHLTLPTTPYV